MRVCVSLMLKLELVVIYCVGYIGRLTFLQVVMHYPNLVLG
jgi:hypothetical protein